MAIPDRSGCIPERKFDRHKLAWRELDILEDNPLEIYHPAE
jgi:hypothetical protein